MPIKRIRTHLKSDFFKSLTVLLSGTLIAQAIGYAIAPILTRLYDTSEMGELALYLRITGFIAAIATMRYELAIPLPKNDSHSYLLYRISLFLAFITLLICSFLFIGFVLSGVMSGFQWWYVLLIILGTVFLVVINIGTNWSIRKGTFKLISRQKVYNSLVSNVLKWIFYFFSWGYFGLILATFVGFFVSSFTFLFDLKKLKKDYKHLRSRRKTIALMKEHRGFPLLNLPHVLVDNGRDMLVASLIFTFYSSGIYGSFSHSYNMLRIPIMLIGVSLGQVFYNEAINLYNKKKPILPLFKKTIFLLSAISIFPFTILFFYGEPIFSVIFGTNWGDAGRYSETMSLWLMINFVISPISALPLLLGKQKIAFILGTISALIQVVPLWIIPTYFGSYDEVFIITLRVISYAQAAWLFLVILIYFRFVRLNDANLNNTIK